MGLVPLGKDGFYLTEGYNILILYPEDETGLRSFDTFAQGFWEKVYISNFTLELINKTNEYHYLGEL